MTDDEAAKLDPVVVSKLTLAVGEKDLAQTGDSPTSRTIEDGPVPTAEDLSSGSEEEGSSLRDTTKACRTTRYRWALILLTLCVVILVLGLSLPLAFLRKKKQAKGPSPSPGEQKVASPANTDDISSPSSAVIPTTPSSSESDPTLATLKTLLPESLYQRLSSDVTSSEYMAYELLLQDDGIPTLQRFTATLWDVSMRANVFQPNVDECFWKGISCETQGVIQKIQWSRWNLTGTLPELIFPNISHLDLGDNQLSSTIPTAWYQQARSLEYVYLHNNALTGVISSEIAAWADLRRLYLGGNQLTGRLPQGLGSPGSGGSNARALELLSLHDNRFNGTLPRNWNLRNLFYLDLGYNQLSGSIPSDWVEGTNAMSRLRLLYLDHNRFSGRLPEKLGEIGNARLTLLSITNNAFTGSFPTFYNYTKKLNILELDGSGVTGFDKKNCKHSVFDSGEMVRLRADCDICPCKNLCKDNLCIDRM